MDCPTHACDPGTLEPTAIDDTLRRINVFRWLAGLGPTFNSPEQHVAQQECAMIMNANSRLSHMPPSDWECWTMAGARGAGVSNIALGYRSPGGAINGFMTDNNVESLGHRRWILKPSLGAVGIGFAGRGMCLSVFGGGGTVSRDWSSYPNQGPAPLPTATARWSFQGYSVRLTQQTTVTVADADTGAPLDIIEHGLVVGGFGPPPAISWEPDGWTAVDGGRYRVTISGVDGGDISYVVETVGC